MQKLMISLSLLILATAGGCAHRERTNADIQGLFKKYPTIEQFNAQSKEARVQIYRDNNRALDNKYAEEREYLKNKRERIDGTPNVGLAISGGGPRSASFSIGVMQALEELGILKDVDVISSVSGGSYVSFWYFTQNCYFNKTDIQFYCPVSSDVNSGTRMSEPDGSEINVLQKYGELSSNFEPIELFKVRQSKVVQPIDYRFQYHLEESSNILSYAKEPGFWKNFFSYADITNKLLVHVGSLPFHWVANGLFDWNWNGNPSRKFYENGLERTYGYVPLSYNLEDYINSERVTPIVPRVYGTQIELEQVRDYLKVAPKKREMPYFVINATGGHDRAFNQFDKSNSIFEKSFYSNKRNMHEAIFEITPWKCGSDLFGYWKSDSCGKDITLSRAVAISGAAVDRQQETVDLGGYGQGVSFLNMWGQTLNIVNGNLGYRIDPPDVKATHPLLRWQNYIPFPFYYLNKYSAANKGIHLSDGGHSENLGAFSLVRRGAKKIIIIDAEEDKKTVYEAANRLRIGLRRELGLELVFDNNERSDNYDTPLLNAVVTGKIHGIVDEDGNNSPIEVQYIKLSMDQIMLQTRRDASGSYPFSVAKYQKKDSNFPHDSTMDIFYNDEQYHAYRDLGYTVASEFNKKPVPELEVSVRYRMSTDDNASICDKFDVELFSCRPKGPYSYFLTLNNFSFIDGEWFNRKSDKYILALLLGLKEFKDYQLIINGHSTQKRYRCDNLDLLKKEGPTGAKVVDLKEVTLLKTTLPNADNLVNEAYCFKSHNQDDDGNLFLSQLRATWFAERLQEMSKDELDFKDIRGVGAIYSGKEDKEKNKTITIEIIVQSSAPKGVTPTAYTIHANAI